VIQFEPKERIFVNLTDKGKLRLCIDDGAPNPTLIPAHHLQGQLGSLALIRSGSRAARIGNQLSSSYRLWRQAARALR
jgi:hypothetical protein